MPFFLAYSGLDNKEHFQTLYKVARSKQIVQPTAAQVMAKADPALKFVAPQLVGWTPGTPLATGAVPLTSTGKIRVCSDTNICPLFKCKQVGILSAFLSQHSIGAMR